jgi:GNAT superfamily N-acetyltransferase
MAEFRVELVSAELREDPERNTGLYEKLIDIWTDVSNAGGAVGFVPPVDEKDVVPVALEAFHKTVTPWSHLFVAYEKDEPIGLAFLEHRPGPLFRHWATVKRLQIHPDRQAKGYGTRFLQEIERIAREELGLEQVHLTARGGTGTETFYERQGYVIVAQIPGVIRVAADDDRDEIYLIKTL